MMHPNLSHYFDSEYQSTGTAHLYPDDISGIRARYGTGSGSVQPLAQARTRTWTNANSGDLLIDANWSNVTAPNAQGSTAVINAAPANSDSFTLNDAMTLGALTYNNPGGRQITGTGTLRFWADSGNALFHTTSSSGYLDPNFTRIILTTSTEFRIEGNQRVDIHSPISGSGALAKTGAQELRLNSSNSTYKGITAISGGVLSGDTIADNGAASAFGTGNFEIANGAVLRYTGSSDSTNRTILMGSGGGGWLDVTDSATVMTVSGVISGSGGLGKSGAGVLRLSGNNTYAGGTQLSEGTLRLGTDERIPNASAVSITGGTFLLSGFSETVGSLSSTTGAATIDGLTGGSLTVTGAINVDDDGTLLLERGTLIALPLTGIRVGRHTAGRFVQNAGTVDIAQDMYVGTNAGSEGTYELNDGALEVSGILTIGFAGIGDMFQEDGEVDAIEISIGRLEDGDGEYVLNDGIIDSVKFKVGEAGIGSVTQNGGRVNVNPLPGKPAQLIIGQSPTGQGTYRLNDGMLDIDTGTITLDDANDRFEFEGGILRVRTFDGDLTNDGGSLAPAGRTDITGDYTQNSGGLGIQIGGYEAGVDFDRINIDGSATLGGLLDVSLFDNFMPEIGDEFKVLTAAAGVTIDGLTLTGSAADMFQLLLINTSVFLKAISPGLPGDFNQDDTVDAADYVAWRKFPSQFGGDPAGYNVWRENFGESSPGSGGGDFNGAAPTPEPSGLLLAVIGGFMACSLLVRRRASNS